MKWIKDQVEKNDEFSWPGAMVGAAIFGGLISVGLFGGLIIGIDSREEIAFLILYVLIGGKIGGMWNVSSGGGFLHGGNGGG